MPRGVLSDLYAVPAEPDEPSKENSLLFPAGEFLDEDYFSKEERPAPKLHRNLTHPSPSNIQVVPSVAASPDAGHGEHDIGYRTEGNKKA